MDASKHVMALTEGQANETLKNGDISDASTKLNDFSNSLLKQLEELKSSTDKKDYRVSIHLIYLHLWLHVSST